MNWISDAVDSFMPGYMEMTIWANAISNLIDLLLYVALVVVGSGTPPLMLKTLISSCTLVCRSYYIYSTNTWRLPVQQTLPLVCIIAALSIARLILDAITLTPISGVFFLPWGQFFIDLSVVCSLREKIRRVLVYRTRGINELIRLDILRKFINITHTQSEAAAAA